MIYLITKNTVGKINGNYYTLVPGDVLTSYSICKNRAYGVYQNKVIKFENFEDFNNIVLRYSINFS